MSFMICARNTVVMVIKLGRIRWVDTQGGHEKSSRISCKYVRYRYHLREMDVTGRYYWNWCWPLQHSGYVYSLFYYWRHLHLVYRTCVSDTPQDERKLFYKLQWPTEPCNGAAASVHNFAGFIRQYYTTVCALFKPGSHHPLYILVLIFF